MKRLTALLPLTMIARKLLTDMTRRLAICVPLALFLSIVVGVGSASAAPVLISPASGSVQTGGVIHVSWNLGETPDPNSGHLTFERVSPIWNYQFGIYSTGATDTFDLPVTALDEDPKVWSGSGSIPDNYYNVTYDYTINGGATPRSVTNTNVRVKNSTTVPNLIAPEADSASNAIEVSYSLPDTPLAGSTKLRISKVGGPVLCTLTLTDIPAATTRTFNLSLSIPWYYPGIIASSNPLSCAGLTDGDYSIELAYRDAAGDPEVSTVATPVKLDRVTEAPTLITPATDGVYPGLIDLSFSLPEVPASWSGDLTFTGPSNSVLHLMITNAGTQGYSLDPKALFDPANTISVSGDAHLDEGLYTVKFSYRDAVNNLAASSATATNVRIGPLPEVPGTGGGGGGTITPPAAKQCFTTPKTKTLKGTAKKKKYKFKLSGAVGSDGQSVQVKVSAPKGATSTYTVAGKKTKGPRVLILLTDGAQNVSVKVKYRGVSKTLKLALPKVAC